MRKKLQAVTALLLAVLLLTTALPFSVSAAEATQDSVAASSGKTGVCTWTLNNGVLTISGNGAMRNYSYDSTLPWGTAIKSIVIENGVTSVGNCAFFYCTNLTSVTIPDSVTSIGSSAFSNCTGLASVTIPDSVTSIGEEAFYNCTGLTSVNISDIAAWCNISFSDSTSNPLTYTHNLYLNNELVTDLVIPDSVTSIGGSAFSGCTGLTSVTIPDSVTSIGKSTFYGCTGLTSVTIPDSVTSIGDYAFNRCSADLMFICNPGSCAETYAINNGYATYYPKFKYTVLDDGTAAVTKYLDTRTEFAIPSTYQGKPVTAIGDWLFLNNSSITSVTIPDSVTHIGRGAFYSCVELKTVTMGNGVTEIGESAFEKCLFLENINLSTSLETIGDEAFYDCRRLKKLDIPATVTTIGEEAFTNCRSLTELTIPAGVHTLGSSNNGFGMFENCKSLAEITIPASVTAIQSNAFDGCKNVTIVGAADSYAQSYAAANAMPFRAIIDSQPVGDTNGDNRIDVNDVTAMQRFFAEFEDFTDEQLAAADTDGNGLVDINDATHLQRYLAEYYVVLGKQS